MKSHVALHVKASAQKVNCSKMEYCLGNGFELLSAPTFLAICQDSSVSQHGSCPCPLHVYYRSQWSDYFVTLGSQRLNPLCSSVGFFDVPFFRVWKNLSVSTT